MKTPKNFEAGVARLDEILAQISDEATPLAQAVKLYAEAAELMAYCNDTLQQTQLQMEQLDLQIKNRMPEDVHNDAAEL